MTAQAVTEVLSCVDSREGMAWRVALFDRHGRALRTIEVEQAVRLQAGTSAPRRATITGPQGRTSRVEVYDGDERYQVPPGTFSPPPAVQASGE